MEAGIHLTHAALRAAAANVRANVPLMSPESAAFIEQELATLEKLRVGG